MRALVFRGAGNVEFGDWPEPSLHADEVLLKVAACGICGTDLHVYRGMPASWPVPGVRGHEFGGHVIALGERVTNVEIGDRVVVQPLVYCGECSACRRARANLCQHARLIGGEDQGGFAETVAVPSRSVFKLPDGLSLQRAALVESLATPVHAFRRNWDRMLGSVAVLGAGPQGLLSMQLAKVLGASQVLVSDIIPSRLEVAQSLGATTLINALDEDPVATILASTNDEGVDLVVEAAGRSSTRQEALRAVRPGGTVILLALGSEQTALDFMAIVPREIRLVGTQCYTDDDFMTSLDLIATGRVNVDPLTTGLPLAKGAEAFRMLVDDPGKVLKVLLSP